MSGSAAGYAGSIGAGLVDFGHASSQVWLQSSLSRALADTLRSSCILPGGARARAVPCPKLQETRGHVHMQLADIRWEGSPSIPEEVPLVCL